MDLALVFGLDHLGSPGIWFTSDSFLHVQSSARARDPMWTQAGHVDHPAQPVTSRIPMHLRLHVIVFSCRLFVIL